MAYVVLGDPGSLPPPRHPSFGAKLETRSWVFLLTRSGAIQQFPILSSFRTFGPVRPSKIACPFYIMSGRRETTKCPVACNYCRLKKAKCTQKHHGWCLSHGILGRRFLSGYWQSLTRLSLLDRRRHAPMRNLRSEWGFLTQTPCPFETSFPSTFSVMSKCPLTSTDDVLQRTIMRSVYIQTGSRGRGSERKGRERWKTVSRAWKFCCGLSVNTLNLKTPCRAQPYLTAKPMLPFFLEVRSFRRMGPEPHLVGRLPILSWRGFNRPRTYRGPLHQGVASARWYMWLL